VLPSTDGIFPYFQTFSAEKNTFLFTFFKSIYVLKIVLCKSAPYPSSNLGAQVAGMSTKYLVIFSLFISGITLTTCAHFIRLVVQLIYNPGVYLRGQNLKLFLVGQLPLYHSGRKRILGKILLRLKLVWVKFSALSLAFLFQSNVNARHSCRHFFKYSIGPTFVPFAELRPCFYFNVLAGNTN
jgi:hypothetical protein